MMRQNLLEQLALFSSLSDEEMRYLLDRSTVRQYEAGEVVFYEGSRSEKISIILKGELEIIKSYASPAARKIKVIGPDEILGEMSLLRHEHYRTATVLARTAAELLDIPLQDFEQLTRQNAELAYTLMQIMGRRMRDTEEATIQDLQEKNRELALSLVDLQEAQAQLIRQEKVEVELATARRIQQSMLPESLPALEGWRIAAHWQPARAVSGDFYDFINLPDGRMALVVGDVTDKGVPAALIMTVTRSLIRATAAQCASPCDLLTKVNNLLCPDMPESMFVTCHVSFLDPHTGLVEFANAGHCLPVWSHDGKMVELKARGMPLGLIEGMSYPGEQVQLSPGDSVLFYSDGLIEAHNEQGAMFGQATLLNLLTQHSGAPYAEDGKVIGFLLNQLQAFTGTEQEQEDDITLVHLEYLR